MKLININDLIIPKERIRKEFKENAHIALSTSIFERGLLHAPVVKNDSITLVAGERRIRAIKALYKDSKNIYFNGEKLPLNQIPITLLENLTEKEFKEVELDENLKRENLTWQEEANAISELHSLRENEAKEEGRKYHYVDTSRELIQEFGLELSEDNGSKKVKKSIIISENLNDEEVSKAKDEKEAIKIIERKKKKEYREKLAKEFDLTKNKSPHILIHGSLFEELPKLENETFDCIIADPPYGENANKFANQGATKHSYEDSPEYFKTIIQRICDDGFAKAKEKAHIYIFCDILRISFIKHSLQESGWDVFKTPLIWNKGPVVGLLPRPEHGPRRTYEAIVFGIKGEKKTTEVFPDVISINAEQRTDIQRGARKPFELYKNLLNRSCLPGDKILDPCCGTGPIFPAASSLKLIATGIEIDDEAVGYCKEKLDES